MGDQPSARGVAGFPPRRVTPQAPLKPAESSGGRDALERTSRGIASRTLVESEDRYHGRIKTLCRRLEDEL